MKPLHLTLKKKWFDKIASGKKTIEYREVKPYWNTRLVNKQYTEIHFKNGYSKSSPFMRIEYKGISKRKVPELNNKVHYCIELGKVLGIRNH